RQLGENGVKIATLTNGTFLKGEVAEIFAKYGTWVRISTDAWDDESIKKFRGIKKDDFTTICNNIKNFTKFNTKCVLGISFVVTHENHKHIFSFANHMKELGVNHIKISGCVISMNGRENNTYHAKIKDHVFAEIKKSEELNDENFKIINHYHDMDESFDKDYKTCRFLQFLTVIGADLKVYTCQDKAYTESGLLGSIENMSFQKFWFSRENREKLLSLNPHTQCKHHCVAHAKNLLINDFLALDRDHIDFV
ncbi:MAG: radical SAM protein, partial [Bacteriovoracaceae bacterium]|nr:radical SAM protein [Bacteriovoracaceae bacterium]